jgi:uncharacterized membrane protein
MAGRRTMSGGVDATRAERWGVYALTAAFAVAYALIGLVNHWKFATGRWDLTTFTQMIWHFSRFELGPDTLRSLSHPFMDHFSPALFVLVPVFWVSHSAETLLMAQGAMLAASIWPVYLFARDQFPGRTAMLIACAYGVFWPLQTTAAADFHELSLAPLPVACAVLAYSRARWPWVWLACVAVVLVREDLIPVVAMLGALTWVAGARAQGLGLITFAVVSGLFVFLIVFPATGGEGGGPFWVNYTWVLNEPWRVPSALFLDEPKMRTWLAWLGPLGFLPLLSPIAWTGIPIVVSRLLSEMPHQWVPGGYYSAPLAPILVMAATDGLARLRQRLPTAWHRDVVCARVAMVILVLSVIVPRSLPLPALFRADTWRLPAWRQTASRALAVVGPGESIASWPELLAQVSPRAGMHELCAGVPPRADVDVVVLPFPLAADGGVACATALRTLYVAWGFATVFDEDGWVVLRRPGA